MNIRKIINISLIILSITFLTGCSESEDIPTILNISKKSDFSYLNGLEAGEYYVLHKDKTYEKTYFGEATFKEGSTVGSPETDSRIMWYKEDYEKIPTLYKDDLLIYYSPNEIDEKINFERFLPYGYTVGLCQLKENESGRFTISTDKEDNNTYPYSDADEIINLYNETVILDKMGGESLRQAYITDEVTGRREVDVEKSNISESGTIKNLEKDKYYSFEIYDGTIKKLFKLKADVFTLGSYETYGNYNYEFIYDNVISIPMPDWFKNGYYAINGKGLFRYVKADSYDDNTDFITPNVKPELDTGSFSSNSNIDNTSTATVQNDTGDSNEDEIKSSFTVGQGGWIDIKVTFDGSSSGNKKVTALLRTPSGQYYEMDNMSDGSVKLEYNAKETGTYVIEYYGLGERIPVLDINVKKKSETTNTENNAEDIEENVETKEIIEHEEGDED